MNFIVIKDMETKKETLINLDNVTEIREKDETSVIFSYVDGTFNGHTTYFKDIKKCIDDITHRNRRIRIDGLKGELFNVKVVNK